MAERLDENYAFTRGWSVSPYRRYLDGSVWRLKRGEDFTAKAQSVVSACKTQAKKLGGRCLARIEDPDTVVVRFVPDVKTNGNGRPRAAVALGPTPYED